MPLPWPVTWSVVLVAGAAGTNVAASTAPEALGVADAPGAADELGVADAPGAADELGVADAPGAADEPGVADAPGAADEPGVADAPGAADELGVADATVRMMLDTLAEQMTRDPPPLPEPLHWLIVTLFVADSVPVAVQVSPTRVPPLAEPLHWVTVAPDVDAGLGSQPLVRLPGLPEPTH
jgi:hypothetical protein